MSRIVSLAIPTLYPVISFSTMCRSSSFSERGRMMPLNSPRVVFTTASLQIRTLNFSRTARPSPLYPLSVSDMGGHILDHRFQGRQGNVSERDGTKLAHDPTDTCAGIRRRGNEIVLFVQRGKSGVDLVRRSGR